MCKNHFNPIHCIIPPYMLTKLMESGNKKIADLAVNSNFRSYQVPERQDLFPESKLFRRKPFWD